MDMNPTSGSNVSNAATIKRLSLLTKLGNFAGRSVTANMSLSPNADVSELATTRDECRNESDPEKLGERMDVSEIPEQMEGQMKVLMPPPQVPPLPVGIRGDVKEGRDHVKAVSSGSDMRRLMDDLEKKRQCFNDDQQELDKILMEIKSIDEKISAARSEVALSNEKYRNLGETAAVNRTELNSAEIKGQVLDRMLKKTEEELNQAMSSLHRLRVQTADASTSFLDETIRNSMLWNCTELGSINRQQLYNHEQEVLQRQNRQLKFELEDFLGMLKAVKSLEKEVENLTRKLEETDASNKKREDGIKQRLRDLRMTLMDVRQKEDDVKRQASKELDRLNKQIEELQSSISSIEAQSVDARATLVTQSSRPAAKPKSSSDINKPTASSYRRFQTPARSSFQSVFQNEKASGGSNDTSNSSYYSAVNKDECMEHNSNEEELCLAAAEEISQAIRDTEPANNRSWFSVNRGDTCPAPAKVPAVEKQRPITAFMRQFSSTKVIKRPSKAIASQAKNREQKATYSKTATDPVQTRTSLPAPSRNFQFKKKTSLGKIEALLNAENKMDSFSFVDDSFSKMEQNKPELYNDIEYSKQNSSREFLEDLENAFDFV